MKIKYTTVIAILFCLLLAVQSFGQQYYYSMKKKNLLKEDTTILVLKPKNINVTSNFIFKRQKEKKDIFFKIDSQNDFLEIKVSSAKERKNLLVSVKDSNEIIYSWSLLKSGDNTIIPTGEILLQPKKEFTIDDIILKTQNIEKIKIKSIDKYGVVTLQIINEDNLFIVANSIYESGLVEWCHPNFWIPLDRMTNDPLFGSQYYLKNTGQTGGLSGMDINVENAWTITKGSNSVKIAVIDDGVEDHEDLVGRVLNGYTPRNATGNGRPINAASIGHGQACAGIIAASQDNNKGITGIAPNCNIIPVNIFSGNETTSDLANAINWAWDQGKADILSNSWGYNTSSQNESGFDNIIQAITNARTNGRAGKGSIVVFASGNNYTQRTVKFPGNVNGVVTVGAIDKNGTLWNYSCIGAEMDFVAPSGDVDLLGDVTTTDRMGFLGYELSNYTNRFGGTSAACPQVSGVCALIISVNPNITELELKSILQTTATDMGVAGFDSSFGFGRINACNAIRKAFTIIGPASFCTSATYTIPNLPAGTTVVWSTTGSCSISGSNIGSSVLVTKSMNGNSVINAIVTSACGTTTVTKNVTVGLPIFPPFQLFPIQPCANQTYSFSPILTNNTSIISATGLINGMEELLVESSSGTYEVPSDVFRITLTLQNDCGTTIARKLIQKSNCSASIFSVYPNPANNEFIVSYIGETADLQTSSNTQKKIETKQFEIELFNNNAKKVRSIKNNLGVANITLNTQHLPNGTYFLHINDGKEIIKKQIIIQH